MVCHIGFITSAKVYPRDYAKSLQPIFLKFGRGLGYKPKKKPLTFGVDSIKGVHPGYSFPFFNIIK